MIYRVDLTDEAFAKIRAQARYIADEGGSVQNAREWLQRVLDAVDSLEHWPRRCPVALENEFFDFEIRMMDVDGFLLLFMIDDAGGVVRVLNARHGRQLPIRPRPPRRPREPHPPA